jgi:hypothetical protein
MTIALCILCILIFVGLLAFSPDFRSMIAWLVMGLFEILKNIGI